MESHVSRRLQWLIVPVFLVSVVACTSSRRTAPTTTAGSSTTAPSTTVADTTVPTSSVPGTEPASTEAPTTTVVAPTEALARVWFVRDERLVAAFRPDGGVEAALTALLTGPSASDPADFTTTIPGGTTLHGVTIADGTATVDLSRQFESGGGTLSMTLRLAEVVFTTTEADGVTGVRFALDGELVDTIGGEGLDVSRPLGRDDFASAKPFILASEPRPGQTITSPLHIVGENSTTENNVEIALTTSNGRILVQTFATGTGPIRDDQGNPVWGPFETTIEFYAGSATEGVLSLTETASDGSGRLIAEYSIPVVFVPVTAATPPPLEGATVNPVLVPAGGCCEAGPGVIINNVTVEHLDGFERLTFEFSAPVANYHIRYGAFPITQDPSDLPVALQGDTPLQITMGATRLDQSVDPPQTGYDGPLRIAGGSGSIVEVVEIGDFEAVSSWVVGLRGQPPFRVSTLTGPDRLVLDIASN